MKILVFCFLGIISNAYSQTASIDSSGKADTLGRSHYQSLMPVMRRDIPRAIGGQTASSVPQREKFVAPKDSVKVQPRVDPILIVSIGKTQGKSSGKQQLSTKSLIIAVGVCALLGAGIAAYVLKTGPSNGSSESNTGIPAPPVPPSNFAPSP
jgi:hypothetical protein